MSLSLFRWSRRGSLAREPRPDPLAVRASEARSRERRLAAIIIEELRAPQHRDGAAATAIDAPHGIEQKDQKSPEGNELEAALG
jgi:hypothetical protein